MPRCREDSFSDLATRSGYQRTRSSKRVPLHFPIHWHYACGAVLISETTDFRRCLGANIAVTCQFGLGNVSASCQSVGKEFGPCSGILPARAETCWPFPESGCSMGEEFQPWSFLPPVHQGNGHVSKFRQCVGKGVYGRADRRACYSINGLCDGSCTSLPKGLFIEVCEVFVEASKGLSG